MSEHHVTPPNGYRAMMPAKRILMGLRIADGGLRIPELQIPELQIPSH